MGRKYYAVASGRQQGVFSSWDECKSQVDKYPNAVFKSFSSQAEADSFAAGGSYRSGGGGGGGGGGGSSSSYSSRSGATTYSSSSRSGGSHSHSSTSYVASSPPSRSTVSSRSFDSAPPTNVYVDGSCLRNGTSGARGGYGGYYGPNDSRNFSCPLTSTERQTNNRGELKAAIHAVRQSASDSTGAPVRIHTDSKYCVEGITNWIEKWRPKDFSGVENSDLWKELDQAVSEKQAQHRARGGSAKDAVQFVHVKGHSGVHGNEMADRLAVEGSMKHVAPRK